jgi:hypothetical protein
MSKVSHLPKNIPSKELPFSIKIKGAVSGFSYSGDFVVRVPGVREQGRIGVEMARLNEGIPSESLDHNTRYIHNAIAYLRVLLIQAPKWFTNTPSDEDEDGMDYGLETDDWNVPIEVFEKAKKAVTAWQKSLKGQPSERAEGQ